MNEVSVVKDDLLRLIEHLKSVEQAIEPVHQLAVSGDLERLPKKEYARVNCAVAYSIQALLWSTS